MPFLASLPRSSLFQLLSSEVTEDSDGVPQGMSEKGRDLLWGPILLGLRVARGCET